MISYQSLLLSTIVLNDIYIIVMVSYISTLIVKNSALVAYFSLLKCMPKTL